MSTKKTISILAIAALATACSKATLPPPQDGKVIYKPNTLDSKIDLTQTHNLQLVTSAGSISSAELFSYISDLQELPNHNEDKNSISEKSKKLFFSYYKSDSTHTRVPFHESPYADLFIAQSKTDFLAETKNLDKIFSAEKLAIMLVIDNVTSKFKFPTGDISVSQAFLHMADFFTKFEAALSKSRVNKDFREQVVSGIYQDFWLKLPRARKIVAELERTNEVQKSIEILKSLINTMGAKIDESTLAEMNKAKNIDATLTKDMSAEETLSFLVELWEDMSPEDRIDAFKEDAPELYDLLNDKNEEQRDCLKTDGCMRAITWLQKKLFVIPAIKNKGTENIQNDIKAVVSEKLKERQNQFATELVATLPETLKKTISDKMDKELARFMGYRKDYDQFVRTELKTWYAKSNREHEIPALEISEVKVQVNKNEINIRGQSSSPEKVKVTADTLGSALKASIDLFNNSADELMSRNPSLAQNFAMMRINQLLAHGGFSLADGRPFPALTRAQISSARSLPLNVQGSLNLEQLFVIPNPAKVSSGFKIVESPSKTNMFVSTQAKLLAGFTSMIHSFRDWAPASMDTILGDIKASQLLGSLPADTPALKKPAFPKDAFAALAIGNAGAVLANFAAPGTPVFRLCVDGTISWQDQEVKCNNIVTALAGLVDIEGGQRSPYVDTAANAEFLISLIDFLKVAEEAINKTQSPYLLEKKPGSDEPTPPIESLKSSLVEVKRLAFGITNLLTNKIQNASGEFKPKYLIGQSGKKLNDTINFKTQLLAIRAVIVAAKYFDLTAYKMAAIDGYHFLNRQLWNPATGFYNTGDSQISPMIVAETLQTLIEVEPLLFDRASQRQIQTLITLLKDAIKNANI